MRMLRNRGLTVLFTMLFLAAAACSPSSGRSDSKVVYLLSWGGTMQSMLEKEGWAKKFHEDTGYTLRLIPKATSAQIIATAISQRKNPQADVVLSAYEDWVRGLDRGVFEPVDEKSVPNVEHVYDLARVERDGELYGVFPYTSIVGLVYNKEVFEKKGWDPPTSWKDLFRPEFAGKVVIPPPSSTYGMYTLIQFAEMNGGGVRDISPGFELYKEIAPSIITATDTMAQLGTLMSRGDAVIAVGDLVTTNNFSSRGIPAEYAMIEPAYMAPGAVGVVKKAQNPKGAHVFMNWWLSAKVQNVRASDYSQTPMVDNVRATNAVAKKAVLSPATIEKLTAIDYQYAGAHRGEWLDQYQREIAPLIREG